MAYEVCDRLLSVNVLSCIGKKRTCLVLSLLATGLAGLLLAVNLPRLTIDLVLASRAVREQQGWRVSFSGPTRDLPVQGYQEFLRAGKVVRLNPDFRRATAWTLWLVPMAGKYRIVFSAESESVVSIDGRTILRARPRSVSRRAEERWVDIGPGIHLVRVDLENRQGGGAFSIGVRVPPLMRLKFLQGDMVAMPRLGNLETWWWVMHLALPLAVLSGILVMAALLSFLLPLTLAERPLAVVLTVLLVLAPSLFIPDLGRREPFIGPMIHRELARRQPRFVFIGNSMLWSRIDDNLLSRLLGGVPVYSIVNFGGLSGIHYLALKYLLIPSHVHPRRVFIFFRGTTLVQPAMRTTGPYFETLIKRISPGPDAEFERLAHGRSVSTASGLRAALNRIFAVQGNREMVRDVLGRLALFLALPGLDSGQAHQRQQFLARINDRFGLKNVGSAMDRESMQSSATSLDFQSAVQDSFLPAIIRLARDHDLPLAFIRVQERPPEDGVVRDTPEMQRFMADLRAYLEENGVAFYDFTGDPDLPLAMYGQGDHIRDPREYTPIFFKRVRGLLQ